MSWELAEGFSACYGPAGHWMEKKVPEREREREMVSHKPRGREIQCKEGLHYYNNIHLNEGDSCTLWERWSNLKRANQSCQAKVTKLLRKWTTVSIVVEDIDFTIHTVFNQQLAASMHPHVKSQIEALLVFALSLQYGTLTCTVLKSKMFLWMLTCPCHCNLAILAMKTGAKISCAKRITSW